ncbi:MAG: GNAT family N-acetyltransferase [Chloroflexota bacterium]
MPDLRVRLLAENESAHWPGPLARMGGFVSLDSWSFFLRKVYGFDVYRFEASEDQKTTGCLTLLHIRHPVFGNYLTTAPFASYGGFAFDSSAARDVLLAEASSLVQKLGVDYALIRFEAGEMPAPQNWVQQPIYATYVTELQGNPEALMSQFSSDHRNHIRKSLKKGFTVSFGHLDLLDDAYEGLARSMHELGSPYHSKNYLREMACSLGERLEFTVIYDSQKKIAGAGVFIFHGETATNLHANILRNVRSDYAGEFLYWSVISRYCQKGLRSFDMGRSLIGSGNEMFKMKWKPRKQMLCYWHYLKADARIPELNQKNPRFRLAIWTWKRLPSFVVRFLGPSLIKGLA